MNNNSKLRYLINLYGEKLGWEGFKLYDLFKQRVFKVEKASEISDKVKEEYIKDFNLKLHTYEIGMIDDVTAKVEILDLFIKHK